MKQQTKAMRYSSTETGKKFWLFVGNGSNRYFLQNDKNVKGPVRENLNRFASSLERM